MADTSKASGARRSFKDQVSKGDLDSASIRKLANIIFGEKVKLERREYSDITSAKQNGSNRTHKFRGVIFWTPPVPKMPTRNLAMALQDYTPMRDLPPVSIIAEHAKDGWSAGSIYSMLNRSRRPLYTYSELLSDNVIVVLDGGTDTPFLLRSITPRSKLIFVTSQEVTADQARISDAIIRYDAKMGLTDELIDEIAANIKHMVQIHSKRPISSYLNLKGSADLPTSAREDVHSVLKKDPDSIVFLLKQEQSFEAVQSFGTVIERLYESASHVLVPSYLNLAWDGILAASADQHLDALKQFLKEGMRCQVVVGQ